MSTSTETAAFVDKDQLGAVANRVAAYFPSAPPAGPNRSPEARRAQSAHYLCIDNPYDFVLMRTAGGPPQGNESHYMAVPLSAWSSAQSIPCHNITQLAEQIGYTVISSVVSFEGALQTGDISRPLIVDLAGRPRITADVDQVLGQAMQTFRASQGGQLAAYTGSRDLPRSGQSWSLGGDQLALGLLIQSGAVQMANDVRRHVEQEHLIAPILCAFTLVRQCFDLAGSPRVSIEPGLDASEPCSVVIEAPVRGEPEAVSEAHWQFSVKAAQSLGEERARIRLVCDIQ